MDVLRFDARQAETSTEVVPGLATFSSRRRAKSSVAPIMDSKRAARPDDVEDSDDDSIVCGFDAFGVPWRQMKAMALEFPSLEGGAEAILGDAMTLGPLR